MASTKVRWADSSVKPQSRRVTASAVKTRGTGGQRIVKKRSGLLTNRWTYVRQSMARLVAWWLLHKNEGVTEYNMNMVLGRTRVNRRKWLFERCVNLGQTFIVELLSPIVKKEALCSSWQHKREREDTSDRGTSSAEFLVRIWPSGFVPSCSDSTLRVCGLRCGWRVLEAGVKGTRGWRPSHVHAKERSVQAAQKTQTREKLMRSNTSVSTPACGPEDDTRPVSKGEDGTPQCSRSVGEYHQTWPAVQYQAEGNCWQA